MDVMQLRRGLMMGGKPSYVKNGLLYHFVSDDSNGQTWTDRVSGKVISLSGVTKNQDGGLYFNGNAVGVCPDISTPAAYTIEVVENCAVVGGIVLMIAQSDSEEFTVLLPDAISIRIDGARYNRFYERTIQVNDPAVISSTSQPITIYNTELLVVFTSAGTFLPYYNGLQIGARANANGTPRDLQFTGSVYQLRIYNRALTAEEIVLNQAIDVQKYNIPTS